MTALEKQIELFFTHLQFSDATVKVTDQDEAVDIVITVSEEQSGILIGYRGEKLNAIQLILTLMVNNTAIVYKPVHLDINGYRQRREDNLCQMADAAATNAIDSGREILLPSLPAYERRIIHLHLEKNDQVETYSEGEAQGRRLVVRPISHQ